MFYCSCDMSCSDCVRACGRCVSWRRSWRQSSAVHVTWPPRFVNYSACYRSRNSRQTTNVVSPLKLMNRLTSYKRASRHSNDNSKKRYANYLTPGFYVVEVSSGIFPRFPLLVLLFSIHVRSLGPLGSPSEYGRP